MRGTKQKRAEEDALKRAYYDAFGTRFDSHCVSEADEHARAIRHMGAMLSALNLKSILDVGAGTGRAAVQMRASWPDIAVLCAEPQPAMIAEARRKGVTSPIVAADGRWLPFRDGSVDAACAFGVLHHERHPEMVVKEMMRVSRRAIFISDSNRFGQGSAAARLLKLALWSGGLWPIANWIRTGGRGYSFSPADGYMYSFSIHDLRSKLAEWAAFVFTIPLSPPTLRSNALPIMRHSHEMLVALRDDHPRDLAGRPTPTQ